MKRIALVLVAAGIGFASCTKENEVKPATVKSEKVMTGEKRDVGGWD